jgi:predicted XRE-type DNA-binding protein
MLSKEELLNHPDYLLTKYQNAIYREVTDYMETNGLNQSDLAKKLNVSNSYVSQVINGNFNFTLKKLIELGLSIGKIPKIEFVSVDEFWGKTISTQCIKVEFTIDGENQPSQALDVYEYRHIQEYEPILS